MGPERSRPWGAGVGGHTSGCLAPGGVWGSAGHQVPRPPGSVGRQAALPSAYGKAAERGDPSSSHHQKRSGRVWCAGRSGKCGSVWR